MSEATRLEGPVLGLDLSTPRAVAALGIPDGSVHALFNAEMTEHLSWLMPAAHNLLSEAGLRARDLTALAVGRGPGSFTGVRTAVITAKAMAHVLGVPVVAPSSLDLIAASVAAEGDAVCACLDARRGELYYAFYLIEGGEPRLRDERRVGPPSRLLKDCRSFLTSESRRLTIAGNGLAAYREQLEPELPEGIIRSMKLYPGGEELISAAARMLARGEVSEALEIVPLYLRLPDSGSGPAVGCTT